MTEELFADIIFYGAPFVFLGAGFALGWTLSNLFRIRALEKEEKEMRDEFDS